MGGLSRDFPCVGVNPRIAWKIRLAIMEVLALGFASGDTVCVLVSHFTCRALIRRELLACLSAVYAFSRVVGSRHVQLWPSVVRELKWACCFIMLAGRDLSACWDVSVMAVDASSWGLGAVQRDLPLADIAAMGRQSER